MRKKLLRDPPSALVGVFFWLGIAVVLGLQAYLRFGR